MCSVQSVLCILHPRQAVNSADKARTHPARAFQAAGCSKHCSSPAVNPIICAQFSTELRVLVNNPVYMSLLPSRVPCSLFWQHAGGCYSNLLCHRSRHWA